MWWRCPLIVILSRCEASKLSLPIFMSWPIGSSNAGLRQSPWNRRGSTGSPFMRSSRSAGLPGSVVNARHVKNVPGRTKTDVLDCQWIQKLHSFGLLNGSFRPDQQIRTLRSLMRLRDNLVVQSTQSVHHMQKALFEMNVQLSNVISDIVGESGMRIVEAILAGERDPAVLAALCSTRIKASRQTVAKSLHGNWREELLFSLRVALESYRFAQSKIAECDTGITEHLAQFEDRAVLETPPSSLKSELHRICGVDLTKIPGIKEQAAQIIISEVGLDMTRWNTEKQFSSFLGLCPNNSISGGKVLRRSTRKVYNRAADALRLCSQSLTNSKTALGAKYRRLKARLGAPKAIVAMAHHLARLVYRMLRYGRQYVEKGIAEYEIKFRLQRLQWLNARQNPSTCNSFQPNRKCRLFLERTYLELTNCPVQNISELRCFGINGIRKQLILK
jgi:transposase